MHTPMSKFTIEEFNKHRTMFDSLPVGVVLLRYPQDAIETANLDFAQLVGKQVVKQQSLSEYFPKPDNRPLWKSIHDVFAKPDLAKKDKIKLQLKNSSKSSIQSTMIHCEVLCRCLLDEQGLPFAVLIFINRRKNSARIKDKTHIDILEFESSFAESTSGFVILEGPELVLQKFNQSYQNFLPGRKLLGRPISEAIPEFVGQKAYAQLLHTYQTGQAAWATESPVFLQSAPDKHSRCFFFDFTYTRIWLEESHCYGILVQCTDKTEAVENQSSIEQTSLRCNLAVETENMGFWEIHLPTFKANWSSRFQEIFGFDDDTTLTSYDFISRIHKEDTATVLQAVTQSFSADCTEKERFEAKFRIQLPGHQIRWVQASGQCFFESVDDKKVATKLLGIVYDITECITAREQIKASQRLFRQISDLLPQFVWTAHPNGQLDYVNKKWSQSLGAGIQDSWLTLIHPDEKNTVFNLWEHSIASHTVFRAEFRLLDAHDNSYRWFMAQAEPAYDANGRVEKWVGVCTDIAAQKAALEERKNFISIASHELRTPLTSLQLQNQTLKRRCDKHDDNALLPDIIYRSILNNEKQITRLSLLVNEMLDFSCIESGMLALHKSQENLCDVVRDVIDRLSGQLESSNIQTSISIPEKLIAFMDKFRIDQAITNILSNAIKYGLKKPIHICLSKHGNCAILEITDHGIGIAPKNLTRIFNRFERAISANEVSGLGIGLYLTQRVIQEHGGHIRVQSTLGSGSTFKVNIPLE